MFISIIIRQSNTFGYCSSVFSKIVPHHLNNNHIDNLLALCYNWHDTYYRYGVMVKPYI